jgi:hypothetical protein
MCPVCMATAVIAAGAVSTGGVYALAAAKFRNRKTRERERGGSNDKQ